ncbi:MAG TPA: hypothetical protein VGN97_15565 [Mesorhizobium sp.]|nr:hypothetical protein [Mesorhizobium sp.]
MAESKPDPIEIQAILFGSQLSAMRKSAEFAAAVDDLTGKLTQAQQRRADLLVQEEAALFAHDGDVLSIRAELKACDEAIEIITKQIEGARRRGGDAEKAEQANEAERVGEDLKVHAQTLRAVYARLHKGIEDARAALAETEPVEQLIRAKSARVEALGRRDLAVNELAIRGEVFAGKGSSAGLTGAAARAADRLLLSMLSPGGPLFRLRGD